MRARAISLAAMFLAACQPVSPLPDMEAGEVGRVVRVIDGDALALNTGQSVRLIGIEAPALRPRGREPDSYAVEASRAMEDMALGREVRLYYSGLTRDRYDRALAHVMTRDGAGPELWLNMELVQQGAARVRLYPDTAAQGETLLAAEDIARRDKVGLWAKAVYRIRPAAELAPETRGFTLVTARLGTEQVPDGKFADRLACQRELIGAQLAIQVRQDASPICDLGSGTYVRLRGWVSDQRLDLTLPLHVEILPETD